MAVFISMRCTLCGHFLQVALTLILVVGYAIAASQIACKIRGLMVTVCPSQFATRRTLFHVLVGCGLLMLKVSRLRSEERFSRNAETELVCRLLLEKEKGIEYQQRRQRLH